MKKLNAFICFIMVIQFASAQMNKIDTSFFSEALQETKMVDVFLPPGYEQNPDMYYSVIYFLHGWHNNQNQSNVIMNHAYDLINSGSIDPVIIVCADNSPDPFGGTYYVNSVLWGDYETYMVNDLPNWIESTYRAMPERNYRGLFGVSMGGYGAFRYGILYKHQYCALASSSGIINFSDDYAFTNTVQAILAENSGPPYFFDYNTSGIVTQGQFLLCGAFTPNLNSPQTWINPAVVEFSIDESGIPIDTVIEKFNDNDIVYMINQLSPQDSLGIYFGIGTQDEWFIYPGTLAVKDSLDLYSIPYEYYEFNGGHEFPLQYRIEALEFLDSLLHPPVITSMNTLEPINTSRLYIFPNPADEILKIKLSPESSATEIEIYTIQGTLIRQLNAFGSEHSINVSNINRGIYVLRVKTETHILSRKLIIN